MSKKLTNQCFIERASIVHNNFYDYSNVNYINIDTKIEIICPVHGVFYQRPDHHLSGHVCKKCSSNSEIHQKRRENIFLKNIELCKKIHNNYYDYTSIKDYKTTKLNVEIICPIHGVFYQSIDSHMRGSKCSQCAIKQNGDNQRLSIREFINRAHEIHKRYYSYEKTSYVNIDTKIKIICPKHGDFYQIPYNHLAGKGCKLCKNQSKKEKIIHEYLTVKKIIFIPQKSFKGCVYKRKLRFDFYIPRLNLCLEYDGKQHYEPLDCFGGVKQFELNKIKDKIKTVFCDEQNIKLIRLNYLHKENQIFKKLEKISNQYYKL